MDLTDLNSSQQKYSEAAGKFRSIAKNWISNQVRTDFKNSGDFIVDER